MTSYNINDLPNEILEIIFSSLPSVVDQINLCLVCHSWRHIILGLRHFHRRHSYKGREPFAKRSDNQECYTFNRHVYIRLPAAGSLNDWGKCSIVFILIEARITMVIFYIINE